MTTSHPADALRSAHEAAVQAALDALDLPTKVAILSGQDFWSLPAVESIGLASVVMSDGPIGVRGTGWTPNDPAIALPSPTALAATWDVDLARRAGNVLGQEARRKGVHVLLAPTVNLHRTPRGGRHFECYSEDPLLTGEIGAGYVQGVQQHSVGVTVKHFVANDSETDRMTVDVQVGDRALRELYLAPFERIAGPGAARDPGGPAWGVMAAYNGVNGATMTEHGPLQRDVLKGEWGFDGVIVSDWTASRSTVATVTGGLDITMPAFGTPWGDKLVEAVESGAVAVELIDEQVRRVLRLAARTGALDGVPPAVVEADRPEPVDGVAFARELAARSFTLVSNDGILPLAVGLDAADDGLPGAGITGGGPGIGGTGGGPGIGGTGGSIAMIGVGAWEARAMGGGSAQVFPEHVISPLDGMRAALSGRPVELSYHIGTDPQQFLRPASGPQWSGGLIAVFVADDGEVLAIEPLPDGTARWLGFLPDGVDVERLATVIVRGILLPQATGAHQLSVRGVGQFTITVAGETVFDDVVVLDNFDDPAAMFLSPPEARIEVDLVEGEPVEVSLTGNFIRMDGMPPLLSLTLGHAEPTADADDLIDEAVRAAAAADIAVVVVGTTEEVESEGFDRAGLALPGRQDDLVSRVAGANPRTVVVVNAGSPVLMPWIDDVAAVLLTWFPGQEAGSALADVLLGRAEPGGRLPTTWPRRAEDCPVLAVEPVDGGLPYDEGVFIGYRGWQRSGVAPLFPFGHGLGYTTWSYDEITVQPVLTDGHTVGRVTVTVTNTGNRAGREIVQLYLAPTDTLPDVDRPARWLAGFAVALAEPGTSVTVEMEVPLRAVQTWADGWQTRPGRYLLEAGRSVETRHLTTHLDL